MILEELMESGYEIRVRVRTLTDVSKIIQILDERGYRNIEMEPITEATEIMKGRFNEAILMALQELDATDKKHAINVEKIILQMRQIPKFRELLSAHGRMRCISKGVLNRTVTMIASAILADKYGWVSYDATQVPRKFWLTKKGLEHIKRAKKPKSE
jgi:DNA-directed RNA polymerase specialized sigma54-like protein